MTDFYARLEEQLVTAARRRGEQGAVGRTLAGRRPQLLAALAAGAAVVAGVAFLPGVLEPTDAMRSAAPASSRPAPPRLATADLSGIRVAVFNATLRPGVARAYAKVLESHGARIETVGNYVAQGIDPVNRVRYRPGAAGKARRVAAALNVPRVTKVTAADAAISRVAEVVVIAGAEGPVPKPAPRRPPAAREPGAARSGP